MTALTRRCAPLLPLALAALAGCGGDDEPDKKPKPVAGTFVSKVQGSEALVSVVAAPPVKGQSKRAVTVFACDARKLCEAFSGSATGNSFTLKTRGGDGEAKGKLTAKGASGTIEPAKGKALRFNAVEAKATSGLYDLTVARSGKLSGASAAGVALKGSVKLPPPGSGSIKLADGKRLKFRTVAGSGNSVGLRPGQVRLIVLPDRQVRGAGRSRTSRNSAFLIRSSK